MHAHFVLFFSVKPHLEMQDGLTKGRRRAISMTGAVGSVELCRENLASAYKQSTTAATLSRDTNRINAALKPADARLFWGI
jgi:hypothetical protein